MDNWKIKCKLIMYVNIIRDLNAYQNLEKSKFTCFKNKDKGLIPFNPLSNLLKKIFSD